VGNRFRVCKPRSTEQKEKKKKVTFRRPGLSVPRSRRESREREGGRKGKEEKENSFGRDSAGNVLRKMFTVPYLISDDALGKIKKKSRRPRSLRLVVAQSGVVATNQKRAGYLALPPSLTLEAEERKTAVSPLI